jgi:hypothetical protein
MNPKLIQVQPHWYPYLLLLINQRTNISTGPRPIDGDKPRLLEEDAPILGMSVDPTNGGLFLESNILGGG